jgi:hypothetical protein
MLVRHKIRIRVCQYCFGADGTHFVYLFPDSTARHLWDIEAFDTWQHLYNGFSYIA